MGTDSAMRSKGGPGAVQSLARATAILCCFSEERSALGVTDIVRMTGLSRSTVHRLLTSLRTYELVQQLPDSRRYALGPLLLRLAHVARSRVNLQALAHSAMTWLRDQVDETVGLHVLERPPARVTVEQVESRQPLRRTYTDMGDPIPLHLGAPGKVLLAFLSEEDQEEVLSKPLEATTPSTITEPSRLRAELDRVRASGYALSFEERIPEVSTLAVPVYDHSGEVVAAMSVTGPSGRLSKARLLEIVPIAQKAARDLSAGLGYVDAG